MGTSTSTGTLAAGSSRTFDLTPGSVVVLTLSPNVRVTITESPIAISGSGVGGNASRTHTPSLPGTFTYGPYPLGGTVDVAVSSNSGSSVVWSLIGSMFPRILAQSAIPFILAGGTAGGSSNQFTMGNNGAISTLPTLPITYPGAWMYMPANAITGSNAAGWYWFVGSSTTAGTLYNNTYTSGDPRAPTVLVPFVSTGPGLGTQTTAANISSFSFSIPGGSMGPNGVVKWYQLLNFSNSANNKTYVKRVAGSSYATVARTTSVSDSSTDRLWNLGVQSQQMVRQLSESVQASTSYPVFLALDATANIVLSLDLQLAASSDFISLATSTVEVLYGA